MSVSSTKNLPPSPLPESPISKSLTPTSALSTPTLSNLNPRRASNETPMHASSSNSRSEDEISHVAIDVLHLESYIGYSAPQPLATAISTDDFLSSTPREAVLAVAIDHFGSCTPREAAAAISNDDFYFSTPREAVLAVAIDHFGSCAPREASADISNDDFYFSTPRETVAASAPNHFDGSTPQQQTEAIAIDHFGSCTPREAAAAISSAPNTPRRIEETTIEYHSYRLHEQRNAARENLRASATNTGALVPPPLPLPIFPDNFFSATIWSYRHRQRNFCPVSRRH